MEAMLTLDVGFFAAASIFSPLHSFTSFPRQLLPSGDCRCERTRPSIRLWVSAWRVSAGRNIRAGMDACTSAKAGEGKHRP